MLTGVINPLNNKERGVGFEIRTYADSNQVYRIDKLNNDVLIPQLNCLFPCASCVESEKANCESCWTQEWSEEKYFYIDEATDFGTCGLQCPDG